MNLAQRIVPVLSLVLAAVYLGAGLFSAKQEGPMNLEAFGRIPVSAEGRTKPLDTFARNTMMVMNGRQTFSVDGHPHPAIEWYLDALVRPEIAADRQVFRIDHPDVVALLGLKGDTRTRFSFKEVSAKGQEVSRQADLAETTPAKKQDPFQRAIVKLRRQMMTYMSVSRMEEPYAVAPLAPGEEWRPMMAALSDPSGKQHPSVEPLRDILGSYSKSDAAGFNDATKRYLELVAGHLPAESRRAGYEVAFNHFQPFLRASGTYVLAFLLSSVGFMLTCLARGDWARSLNRATIYVIAATLVVHTIGIVSRIYLQGRPPVTNLYSSAVFIGWICILLGLATEWFFRTGLGSIASSAIGFSTLVVAHNLSSTGDTMEMMQAVLDTNFWLATHVVVVTIGYSATFLAGFLAIGYIVLGVFTRVLQTDTGKSLPKMVYGVICFAALASFVGTVLGGIWADQSWGRFWGWDPKENGAALIVLMNVLTLHARWGGMVRERGVAVLAVCGNIVTAWSWFGTNMLGVGLHSYGFMASAVFWLAGFMLVQVLFIAIGLIPRRFWRSTSDRVRTHQRREAAGPGKGVPQAV